MYMSIAHYLGSPKRIYLASPRDIYPASPKNIYLSSPKFCLSSPSTRSEYDKKVWKEYMKFIAKAGSYAEKFLKDALEMDPKPRELKERFDKYVEDFRARVKAREARLWGK